MRLEEIKVPKKFLLSTPKESKVREKLYSYRKDGELGEIVVDAKGNLLDGYISYLILKEDNYSGDVKVKKIITYKDMATVYVWGRHLNSTVDKDYVWRLTNKFIENNHILDEKNLIGKQAMVMTKFGPAPITITDTQYLDSPPVEGKIKKVIGLIRK